MQSFSSVYVVVFAIARWNVYPLHTETETPPCVSNKFRKCVRQRCFLHFLYKDAWFRWRTYVGLWKTKPIIASSLIAILCCKDVSHSLGIHHSMNFILLLCNYASSNCPQPSPFAPLCTIQRPPSPRQFLKIHMLKAKHMCTVTEECK